MTTKTTGAEWQAYHADKNAWPPGAWYEECAITADGVEIEDHLDLSATSQVTIEGGVYWPGDEMVGGVSLETHFSKWRKAQTVERIVVEVARDHAKALRDALKMLGGKEIK